jgi:hypothetical protein
MYSADPKGYGPPDAPTAQVEDQHLDRMHGAIAQPADALGRDVPGFPGPGSNRALRFRVDTHPHASNSTLDTLWLFAVTTPGM